MNGLEWVLRRIELAVKLMLALGEYETWVLKGRYRCNGAAAYNDKRQYGMAAKAIQIIDQLYRKQGFNCQKNIKAGRVQAMLIKSWTRVEPMCQQSKLQLLTNHINTDNALTPDENNSHCAMQRAKL